MRMMSPMSSKKVKMRKTEEKVVRTRAKLEPKARMM